MTPAELEASLEGLSDEELKAKLADMESGLQKQLGKANQQFNQTLKSTTPAASSPAWPSCAVSWSLSGTTRKALGTSRPWSCSAACITA